MSFKILMPLANQTYATRSSTYTADAHGVVTVPTPAYQDILDLVNGGGLTLGQTQAIGNIAATVDPTASSDNTQDYGVGSRWLNNSTGVEWICLGAATGAAVWVPQAGAGVLVGRLLGANMNSTVDQLLTPALFGQSGLAKYRVTKVTVKNASASLTTAAGGVYPAASKGGTALVSSAQAYSSLTSAALALDLTLATPNAVQSAGTPLYLSLTTAQGAAATADVYVFADVYV